MWCRPSWRAEHAAGRSERTGRSGARHRPRRRREGLSGTSTVRDDPWCLSPPLAGHDRACQLDPSRPVARSTAIAPGCGLLAQARERLYKHAVWMSRTRNGRSGWGQEPGERGRPHPDRRRGLRDGRPGDAPSPTSPSCGTGSSSAALADPSRVVREALAARYGVLPGVHEGHRALLGDAGGLDAVLIASPHATHAPAVLAALAAGFHVFGEKPLASRWPTPTGSAGRRSRRRGRPGRLHQTP